ncbi:YggS family pyridoxal phosphate-dependent enzyme [Legionella impletisoli]|uniref:Pyridoxal phosphate homeostasis protein n=1 Tax=Legionella impletisoli TaxID=343510 RepID=A0A917JVL8_9GAMM|nr:YggS family pyridoxal phosphate-dependent enzyme [Legionella impletisoli]GGI85864.1 YggS family pyridoxal phosphate enzyme [Legionella impletisoli]
MTITLQIEKINKAIIESAKASGRSPDLIKLLAVSKGQTVDAIKRAYYAGIRDFGENYLQEALPKINALPSLDIQWHFIGHIQSNKAREIAEHVDWVHSVSRLSIARALNQFRTLEHALNICLQINLDNEATKSGIPPEEAPQLVAEVLRLSRLKLRGLMVIPTPSLDENQQYERFLRVHHLLQSLNQEFKINMDTLSMGMSHDFPAAIRAGSTIVRIGQAIFGKRP